MSNVMPHKVIDWHAGGTTAVVDGKSIAREILNGVVAPADGCGAIAALCIGNDWPEELQPFTALSHEQDGHEHLSFDRENTAPLIIEACRTLLGEGNDAQQVIRADRLRRPLTFTLKIKILTCSPPSHAKFRRTRSFANTKMARAMLTAM